MGGGLIPVPRGILCPGSDNRELPTEPSKVGLRPPLRRVSVGASLGKFGHQLFPRLFRLGRLLAGLVETDLQGFSEFGRLDGGRVSGGGPSQLNTSFPTATRPLSTDAADNSSHPLWC